MSGAGEGSCSWTCDPWPVVYSLCRTPADDDLWEQREGKVVFEWYMTSAHWVHHYVSPKTSSCAGKYMIHNHWKFPQCVFVFLSSGKKQAPENEQVFCVSWIKKKQNATKPPFHFLRWVITMAPASFCPRNTFFFFFFLRCSTRKREDNWRTHSKRGAIESAMPTSLSLAF